MTLGNENDTFTAAGEESIQSPKEYTLTDAVVMVLYVPRASDVPGGFLFLRDGRDHPEPLRAAGDYLYVKLQGCSNACVSQK